MGTARFFLNASVCLGHQESAKGRENRLRIHKTSGASTVCIVRVEIADKDPGGLTFAWGDVTRVGNVGYFSCINFRRYSVTCDEPHGILQRTLIKVLFKRRCTNDIPLCVAENSFAVQDGND